ncbi:hypothetical protein HK105_200717 [Polyrhizophydium stewartii]|uniref:Uncharacterized protein n=1 Tax=Polyrhizophydium stewartii TaxID=2732419 RepID=A0ABR4NJZ2_9FUNG|nr:hypothetical protein HK105_005310 [Polyrhizophydium stewartii]
MAATTNPQPAFLVTQSTGHAGAAAPSAPSGQSAVQAQSQAHPSCVPPCVYPSSQPYSGFSTVPHKHRRELHLKLQELLAQESLDETWLLQDQSMSGDLTGLSQPPLSMIAPPSRPGSAQSQHPQAPTPIQAQTRASHHRRSGSLGSSSSHSSSGSGGHGAAPAASGPGSGPGSAPIQGGSASGSAPASAPNSPLAGGRDRDADELSSQRVVLSFRQQQRLEMASRGSAVDRLFAQHGMNSLGEMSESIARLMQMRPDFEELRLSPSERAKLDLAAQLRRAVADSPASLEPYPDPLDKIEPPDPDSANATPTHMPHPNKKLPDPFSYRHYKTFHPCSNKLLAMKWDQTLRQQHLKKLLAAKPTIDNSAPKPHTHLQVKLKKLQMEEDRLAQIERNNRILLEKMSHIMEMEAKDPNIHGDRDYAHSLNGAFRAREMTKIRAENRALLLRLEAKPPHYDHLKWIDERMRNLTYLQNISSYPQRFIELRKTAKQHSGPDGRRKMRPHNQEKLDELRAVFMPPVVQPAQASHDHASEGQQTGRRHRGGAKPKTPVADIDKQASEREPRSSVPLPEIGKSASKIAIEQPPAAGGTEASAIAAN